jgi:hypothetical protein
VIPATQEVKVGGWRSEVGWRGAGGAECETLPKKYLKQKRAGGVSQVVECLSNKLKALSSNLLTVYPHKKRHLLITFKASKHSDVSLSRLTKRCQQTAGRLQEHKPHRKVVQRWLHVGGVGCSSV